MQLEGIKLTGHLNAIRDELIRGLSDIRPVNAGAYCEENRSANSNELAKSFCCFAFNSGEIALGSNE